MRVAAICGKCQGKKGCFEEDKMDIIQICFGCQLKNCPYEFLKKCSCVEALLHPDAFEEDEFHLGRA